MSCKENCNCTLFHKDIIEDVENHLHGDNLLNETSELLKVLADFTRLKILDAIKDHELCVCDLAHVIGVTKSGISHQMKTLKNYNLVSSNKIGKMVYYKANNENVKKIMELSLNHVRGNYEKNN